MSVSLVRSFPQPGGRSQAPGELALVQAFVNSFWDLESGGELLGSPAELGAWLAAHDLAEPGSPVSDAELARALAVREGLRDLLFRNNGRERPLPDGLEAPVSVALGAEGPELRAAARDVEGALGRLLGVAALAMLDGSWKRLKACPGRHCGWAFYDHSRNQAGTWCSMRVCGGREKARAYYRRSRGG